MSDLLELEFIFLFVTLCSKTKLPAEGILGADKAGRGSIGGVGCESEKWGLTGLCVRKFKGDMTHFLLMKLLLLLVTPSFPSFLSFSEGRHPGTFSLLPLFPTSPSIHFSILS